MFSYLHRLEGKETIDLFAIEMASESLTSLTSHCELAFDTFKPLKIASFLGFRGSGKTMTHE